MGKGASGGGDVPDLGIPYLAQTLGVIVSARAGWLSVFFAGLLLTMVIMQSFEEVLEANVQLSFFVPLIVGHAGNTGSQAVSTVIRALALSEAALCDSCHITRKEFLAGGAIGLFLASFAYPLGVWIAGIPLRVMFSVAVSLPCVSCVANLIGAGLPLVCEKFHLDPAVIAAPMMTTMVDCSGILTYLMISQVIIGPAPEHTLEEHEAVSEGEHEHNVVAPCSEPIDHEAGPPPPPMHGEGNSAGKMGLDNHTLVGAQQAGDDAIDLAMTVLLVLSILATVCWAIKSRGAGDEEHDAEKVEGEGVDSDHHHSNGALPAAAQDMFENGNGETGNDSENGENEFPAPRVAKLLPKAAIEAALHDCIVTLNTLAMEIAEADKANVSDANSNRKSPPLGESPRDSIGVSPQSGQSPRPSPTSPTPRGRRRRRSIFSLGTTTEVDISNVRMDANKMMRQLADLLGVEMVLKAEAEKHMQYLQTVPLLKHLSAVELNKVVQSMQVCRFSIGQTVIVQGEIGNDMFVVESGRAACTKEGENGGEPIAHYSAGEFFGERSLLANEPRSATITAESDLCTLRLDRTAYELILESSREAGAQIEMLQKQYNRLDFYHRTAGAVVGRSGGFGQVGGPTVSQAMRGIFKRRKSIEVLSIENADDHPPVLRNSLKRNSAESRPMGAGRPQSNSFTMNPVQLADVEYGHSAAPSPASMPRPPLPEMLPLPPSHPVRPAYTGWGDAPAPEQVRTRSHRAPANDGGRSDQIMSTPPPLPRSMSGRDSKQRPQAQLQLHQPYPEAAVEEAV